MNYNDGIGYNGDGSVLDEEIAPGVTVRDYLLGMPADSAVAVLAAAQTTPVHADVRKMNDAQVHGSGTNGDQWRGFP